MRSTAHFKESVLKHLTGIATYTPPSTYYLGLGDYVSSSTFTELSGNGYARQAITWLSTDREDDAGARYLHNGPTIDFPAASGSNWSFDGFGVYDASTGGNLLFFEALRNTQTILDGDSFSVDLEALLVSFAQTTWTTGGSANWSKFLQEKMIDLLFHGTSYEPSDIYIALYDEHPKFGATGSTFDELVDETGKEPGYARVQYGRGSSKWSVVTGSKVDSNQISFAQATDDWDRPACGAALVDAATDGNLLWYQPIPNGISVFKDDHVSLNPVRLTLG